MTREDLSLYRVGVVVPTQKLSRAYAWIARRPLVATILVAATALILAFSASAARGFRAPSYHNESSYLLGAETFFAGRLTNPAHPMGRYFETFHVLQRPTYSSKYPPANALFIAAGWRITGSPIAGVWLSFAFMCVATCWMLLAWTGAKWGLGVSLASTSDLAASYWTYTYWGGAVAAAGGALLMGALYRIVWRQGGCVTGRSVVGLFDCWRQARCSKRPKQYPLRNHTSCGKSIEARGKGERRPVRPVRTTLSNVFKNTQKRFLSPVSPVSPPFRPAREEEFQKAQRCN